MRRLTLPLTLGLAHGAADGAAGYLLGGLGRALPLGQVALLVLLYNALAFGAQPLVGLAADRAGRPRLAALAGLLLLGAALALAAPQPRLAVALAGLGSAAFHVGGGALALAATRGRAAGPGLFASPGVVGLAAGGALAAAGYAATWPLLIALPALAGAIWLIEQPALPYAGRADGREPPLEAHDLVMLALLAAIALRSAVWSSLELLAQGRYETLLAMAASAAAGKALGGALADRIGLRRWMVGALALAAPLLALGGGRAPALLLGVALLQSATPAALAALGRSMPRAPATAAGLGLGLAIAAGGLPAAAGLAPALASPPAATALLLAAALAIWWSLRAADRAGRAQKWMEEAL